jgi:hypothetical protein
VARIFLSKRGSCFFAIPTTLTFSLGACTIALRSRALPLLFRNLGLHEADDMLCIFNDRFGATECVARRSRCGQLTLLLNSSRAHSQRLRMRAATSLETWPVIFVLSKAS